MSKYEQSLTEVKNQLSTASQVAILMPSQITVDKMAAGLSLMLALRASGKQVSIATEGIPLVSHTNLFGLGQVQNSLTVNSSGVNGNQLTLTLENVVAADGTVPALEKLDWYPEGPNLNLVFHIAAGQKFEPTNIKTQSNQSTTQTVYFIIGATNVNDLGSLYSQNANQMLGSTTVNIDNSPNNGNFGKTNIVDPNASSISEIVAQMLPDLGLSMDQDIASNIVAGIYNATQNLTQNVKPDTFVVVSQAMQAGAQMPQASSQPSQPKADHPMDEALSSQPASRGEPAVNSSQSTFSQPQSGGFDMSAFNNPVPPAQEVESQPVNQVPFTNQQVAPQPMQAPAQPTAAPAMEGTVINPPNTAAPSNFPPFMQPPVVPPTQNNQPSFQAPSPEERPSGEFATSRSPETSGSPAPDWLTPKIFKGSAN